MDKAVENCDLLDSGSSQRTSYATRLEEVDECRVVTLPPAAVPTLQSKATTDVFMPSGPDFADPSQRKLGSTIRNTVLAYLSRLTVNGAIKMSEIAFLFQLQGW